MSQNVKGIRNIVKEYGYLIIGSFIIALSFNLFLNPNGIVSGGVSGLSTIIEYQFGIEPAFIQGIFNIPLFFVGIIFLGKQFGVKTTLGSILIPLFIYLTKDLTPLTNEYLLASVYGGVGIGLGLGLVFQGKASTGGTDILAQIIHKYTRLTLGVAILFIDGLIVITSGIVFGPERALYALISLFIISKTVDMVQMGLSYSKIAFIISNKQVEMRKTILNDLDRGITIMNATGGYTGSKRSVLMVVFQQNETTKIKELVRLVDPLAFIIVTNANEVLGKGFKSR